MKFPGSVLVSAALFVAKTVTALCLSITYNSARDRIWQNLLPCVLVQLSLLFIHQDLGRDRPLVLLLHLLQLGPLVRCVEVFYIYFKAEKVEEPYFCITKKKQMPKGDCSVEVEKEVGQAEGKLFTQRAALSRASVIQAFLGSAPQLTLQLYISVLEQEITVLRCKTDFIFRIYSRIPGIFKNVVLLDFLVFLFYPWNLFWQSKSPFPENIEKALSRVGTVIVLCFLTFLYAGINVFCWSSVLLKINNRDLINKSQNWYCMVVFYMLRLIENASLLLLWYIFKVDIYIYVCAALLVLHLLIGYCIAVLFMLVFYQFCHPCKKLLTSSISDGLLSCFKFMCYLCIPLQAPTKMDKCSAKL
ncbi:hypothetical protein XELAEV_18015486mg [Xenopus laevis]|uniref:XK-related protein n=1 Tax=Xenopus laevis TaxID=8355 RepID=A0A974HWF1_XENLA|nr:hypothetical protein XELAEV_18015486mg [Xenopus laevis]